jgi:hypothetical protein
MSTLTMPRFLRQSPLVTHHGGIAVTDHLPDAAVCGRLYEEAAAALATASRQEHDGEDYTEWRGGTPRRRLYSAEAGPAQDEWYLSPQLAEALSDLCRLRVSPSGTRGSYSYYAHAGDFLDLHRDVETCDVTLITCLHDNSDATDPHGALVVYPDRLDEPLSAIRGTPDQGAYPLKLVPGQSAILMGGVVPHFVQPVGEGQVRVISALCFVASG